MNHFMLPLDGTGGTRPGRTPSASSATRYGNVAMERLVNDHFKARAKRVAEIRLAAWQRLDVAST